MPRGDGTGPAGMGPMTGRGAGYCAGYPAPGCVNPAIGVGFGPGLGLGRGRGWRNRFYATGLPGWMRASYGLPAWVGYVPPTAAPPSPDQEVRALKAQAEHLSRALDAVRRRINELEKKEADE